MPAIEPRVHSPPFPGETGAESSPESAGPFDFDDVRWQV